MSGRADHREEFARRLPARPLELEELGELYDGLGVDEAGSMGGPSSAVAFYIVVDGELEAYRFDEERGRWVAVEFPIHLMEEIEDRVAERRFQRRRGESA